MRSSLAKPVLASVALTVALAAVQVGTGSVPAPGMRLAGVDVASYQHYSTLDWAMVKAAGQDFAFVKATEGTGYTNPFFAADWASLQQVGMARGAYHYARPDTVPGSAVAQAQYYLQATGLMHESGALAPMLDMEESGGLTPTQLQLWTKTWLDTVQALTGRVPVIYTYPYFWQTAMGNSTAFTNYPLFLADYHDLTGTTAPGALPGGWPTWTFWQYSDAGTVPGIAGLVDLDHFHGPSVNAATWGYVAPAPVSAVTSPLAAYVGQLLQTGSSGPAVAALQQVLGTTPDGAFGPLTAAALSTFQTSHGLPATAMTDTATWAALVAATPLPTPVTTPVPTPVTVVAPAPVSAVTSPLAAYVGQLLQTGSSGPAVAALQQVLGATPDGAFGPLTAAALSTFQTSHGLPATAMTDTATWAALVPATPLPTPVPAPAPVPVTAPAPVPVKPAPSTLSPAASNPFGSFDAAQRRPGGVLVAGWAIDPNTQAPVLVHVYVDGKLTTAFPASNASPDVAAAYPGTGPAHRFAAILALADGTHQVCTYAINIGSGTGNPRLGCRAVVVQHHAYGAYDTATRVPGGIRVTGWAIAPDTAAPVSVDAYVDGRLTQVLTAAAPRPDVAAVNPGYGAAHGLTATLAVAPGTHTVCLYPAQVGQSLNPGLGCRTVTVNPDPIGVLDLASVSAGTLTVAGWALDGDTTAPVQVSVQVDGRPVMTTTANRPRNDLLRLFAPYGPDHGFTVTVPVAAARHLVCIYGHNIGAGQDRLLGCRSL